MIIVQEKGMGNIEKIRLGAVVYALYAAIIPLNMVLNFTGFTINRFIGMIAIVFFVFEIAHKRPIALRKEYLCIVMFFAWCVMTIGWTIAFDESMNALRTLVMLVVLTLLGLIRGMNDKEIRLVANCMVLTGAILIVFLAPNLDVSYSRATLTTSAGTADQNGLAANLVLCLLASVHLLSTSNSNKTKLLYIVTSVSILMSILNIGSRGAILAMIVALVIYYQAQLINFAKHIRLKTFIFGVICLIVLVIGIRQILNTMNTDVIARLSIAALKSDGGSGRSDIWVFVFQDIINNPIRLLFGYGVGTESVICQHALNQSVGIHNVYLEYLATTGIIGFALLMNIFVKLFVSARKSKNILGISLIISLMIVCIPLGFLLNKGTWNIILIVWLKNQNIRERASGNIIS